MDEKEKTDSAGSDTSSDSAQDPSREKPDTDQYLAFMAKNIAALRQDVGALRAEIVSIKNSITQIQESLGSMGDEGSLLGAFGEILGDSEIPDVELTFDTLLRI